MCGVFGIIARPDASIYVHGAVEAMEALFRLSESRGKEAAGIVVRTDRELIVYKEPRAANLMIRQPGFRDLVHPLLRASSGPTGGLAFIGHSRLVTDGDRNVNFNNQPVVTRGAVGVHNGIVVNHAQLWARHPQLKRRFDVDSEVIFALLEQELEAGSTVSGATSRVFAELYGVATIGCFMSGRDAALVATNNGSLYFAAVARAGVFVFTSERFILEQLVDAGHLGQEIQPADITHVRPGGGVVIDTRSAVSTSFRFDAPTGDGAPSESRTIVDRSPSFPSIATPRRHSELSSVERRFPHISLTHRLKRCVRCVLPDSMPFIRFDARGVCSYCHNYEASVPLGRDALEAVVAPQRSRDGRPDCIVGLSGGRDSSYGLHYIKNVLGMNPIAYTYDWGMITDLARRNISRICGKLGIEHVLVSADIPRKREYIRQNVSAWLARPALGTIPLFMAGDKAYFHHLNQVRSQVRLKPGFLCENLLERTDFKTGFAGVRPAFHDSDHVYTMALRKKLALLLYFGKEYLLNPRYLNASLTDSMLAFAYYYVIDRDYHNLYRYVPWVETEVVSTLIGEYDFELAPDTPSTWRIGDGTAAFYNYIYYAVAGFTENETFRSNQIREGVLTREQALEKIEVENRPRFETIQWYLDTIGLDRDLVDVLTRIQAIPKLYQPIV